MKLDNDLGWLILKSNSLKRLAYGSLSYEKAKEIINITLEVVPDVIDHIEETKAILSDEHMVEFDNGDIIYRVEVSEFIKEGPFIYFKIGKMTTVYYYIYSEA